MRVHVIYSHEPGAEPSWTYRSHPIACFGMADSLPEAREDFSEALALTLDEGEQAPEVVEHLERRHPAGFWIRIQLTPDARERDYAARIFLSTWGQSGEPRNRPPRLIERTRTDIGEPIMIACLPEDTIGSVVEQLNTNESCAVLLSFSDLREGIEGSWVSGIARGEAAASADYPAASLDEQGLTRNSTMREMMEHAVKAAGVGRPEPLLVVA